MAEMQLKGMAHKAGKAGLVRVSLLVDLRGDGPAYRLGLHRWEFAGISLAVDVQSISIPIYGPPPRMQCVADMTEADLARLCDLTSAWMPVEITQFQPDLLGGAA